jgi:hypothetical protein
MKKLLMVYAVLLVLPGRSLAGPIPDTEQTTCYDDAPWTWAGWSLWPRDMYNTMISQIPTSLASPRRTVAYQIRQVFTDG